MGIGPLNKFDQKVFPGLMKLVKYLSEDLEKQNNHASKKKDEIDGQRRIEQ